MAKKAEREPEAQVTCAIIQYGYTTRYYGRDGEWVPVDCWSKQEERGEAPIITLAYRGDKGRKKDVLLTSSDSKCGSIYDDVLCFMSPDGELDHEQLRAVAAKLGYGTICHKDKRIFNSGKVQFLAAITSGADAPMPISRFDYNGQRCMEPFKRKLAEVFDDSAPIESSHMCVSFWVKLSELATG